MSDSDLVEEIRAVLAACPFHGEGYRKVRARLAHRGLGVGGKRVLRVMRTHRLLAPRRLGPPNGNPAHDGTITTDRPDVMWGTDATRFSPSSAPPSASSASRPDGSVSLAARSQLAMCEPPLASAAHPLWPRDDPAE